MLETISGRYPVEHELEDRARITCSLMTSEDREQLSKFLSRLQKVHCYFRDILDRSNYRMRKNPLDSEPSLSCHLPRPSKDACIRPLTDSVHPLPKHARLVHHLASRL